MFEDAAADRARGRPSRFSDEISVEICRRLAGGESLRSICRDEAMPHVATVLRWLPEHPEFRDQYARAREAQAELFADELIALADSVQGCTDNATVNAARLAIDTRKWAASKLLPRKYGDKIGVESSGNLVVKIIHGLGDED
jgi:hypothetical protein